MSQPLRGNLKITTLKKYLILGLAMLMHGCISADSLAGKGSGLWDLYRGMPVEFLAAGGAFPDPSGMVGHNRQGFKASAFQRGATLALAFATVKNDEKEAENAWRAVEATFSRQSAEGNFNDPPGSVAFWLCELNRSLLVLRYSSLAQKFEPRISALLPRIRRAAGWLSRHKQELEQADSKTPNRLFFDAEAFLLSGTLLQDQELSRIGNIFLHEGLKLYRDADGVFLEMGGADSSYQAVNLIRLQEINAVFPDRFLEQVIAKGAKWELNRIGPDGAVDTAGNTRVYIGGEKFMGKEKQVNVPEVCLAFLYYYARTGDREALDAVKKMKIYHKLPHSFYNMDSSSRARTRLNESRQSNERLPRVARVAAEAPKGI